MDCLSEMFYGFSFTKTTLFKAYLSAREIISALQHPIFRLQRFLCGGNHKEEDARVVSLVSILNIDETMGDLAELDYGECAEAESITSDWIVSRMNK